MALKKGNPILATDFINLKARIKAECKRRNLVGSVSKYGGKSYDYTVTPEAGNAPLPEHYNKITIPFTAITGETFFIVTGGDNVPSLNRISTELATLEKKGVRASNSGCASSCTGLCQGTCSGNCTGSCSNSCKGSCTGSCKDGCKGGCTGGCTTSCSTHCANSCEAYCENSCTGSCADGCLNGCRGSCKGSVSGT